MSDDRPELIRKFQDIAFNVGHCARGDFFEASALCHCMLAAYDLAASESLALKQDRQTLTDSLEKAANLLLAKEIEIQRLRSEMERVKKAAMEIGRH